MNIEQAIQSSNFAGEDHKLAINLLNTASWYSALWNKHFYQFGITMPQHNVLRILRGCHPDAMSVGNVQSRMVDKSSNVTRLVLKLREKGYAIQKSNADNKRIQEIKITESGLEFIKYIESFQKAGLEHLNVLTEAEQVTLNTLLDKLRFTE
jgi:DNA-binding MarR family transcriptional regulator